MKRKLFSIISATYNCGPKLELTIQSVLSQKTDLFEFIIVDGGSTDGTLEILKKYEGRVKFVSEKDRGVYDALNKGIDLAEGKYLYFLGAGDILRNDILEQLEADMPDEPAAFVYGIAYFAKSGIYHPSEFSRSDIGRKNLCHQSIFYERQIFDLVGKYDLRYTVFADWALNLKCFARHDVRKKYVRRVIADYEEGGLSETLEDPSFMSEFPQLVKEHLGNHQLWLYKIDVARAYLHKYKNKLFKIAPESMESSLPPHRRAYTTPQPDEKTNPVN